MTALEDAEQTNTLVAFSNIRCPISAFEIELTSWLFVLSLHIHIVRNLTAIAKSSKIWAPARLRRGMKVERQV